MKKMWLSSSTTVAWRMVEASKEFLRMAKNIKAWLGLDLNRLQLQCVWIFTAFAPLLPQLARHVLCPGQLHPPARRSSRSLCSRAL